MLALHPMRAVLANALTASPALNGLDLLLLLRGAATRMTPAAALAMLLLLAIFDVSVGLAGVRFVPLIILILVVAVVFLAVLHFALVLAGVIRPPLLLVVIVVVIIGAIAVLAPLLLLGCFLGLLIHILPQIFQCLELVLEYILLLEAFLEIAPGARVTLSHRLRLIGATVLEGLLDLLTEFIVAVRWVFV